MKKILTSTLLVLFLGLTIRPLLAQDEYYPPDERIVSSPYLEVDVWVDQGDGSVYNPGDEIKVFFETSTDCYVVVYNIDTRGYVNILYPYDHGDSPWVEGNRVYRIPGRYDDYSLRVDGPEGVEYVHAIASLEPIVLPDWPRYVGGMTEDNLDITVLRLEDEDPYDFMETIDQHIVRGHDYATDLCIFNVEYPYPRWYSHPRAYWAERPWYYPVGEIYIGCHFGAQVYIDGMFYGVCPITIPALICGRHFISVYYFGCRVWWDWIHIYPERTIRIRADFPRRYRFTHDGVVKKKYRIRKEKKLLSGGKTIAVKEKDLKISQKKKSRVSREANYIKKKEQKFEGKNRKRHKEVSAKTYVDRQKKVKSDTNRHGDLKITKKTKQKSSSAELKKAPVKKTKRSSFKKAKSSRKPAQPKRSKVNKTSSRRKR